MIRYTKPTSTITAVIACILGMGAFLSACNENCEFGTSKCEDNQIFTCKGSTSHRDTYWVQYRNCDDFNAECQEGVVTKYLDCGIQVSDDPKETDASCVTESYNCQNVSGYFCTEENDIVINCTIPEGASEPVAAISVDNWQNRPFCVASPNGTIFAYLEDLCDESDEPRCDEEDRTLYCAYNTWQQGSGYCHFPE